MTNDLDVSYNYEDFSKAFNAFLTHIRDNLTTPLKPELIAQAARIMQTTDKFPALVSIFTPWAEALIDLLPTYLAGGEVDNLPLAITEEDDKALMCGVCLRPVCSCTFDKD